ncbi:unnamed protein product [Soboliphyme baturini]|uniref:PID domain-containing protein n=1 Tax=Soboliphyme baturini TaxID=241478 RepID=A0A183IA04_9BILA|nr:unnamed protein product [Soboliphyme baturini]
MCNVVSTESLEVNCTKKKIFQAPDSTNDPKIQWSGTAIEEVENFKFLSVVLVRDGSCDTR